MASSKLLVDRALISLTLATLAVVAVGLGMIIPPNSW
jgi:hypothetical protein